MFDLQDTAQSVSLVAGQWTEIKYLRAPGAGAYNFRIGAKGDTTGASPFNVSLFASHAEILSDGNLNLLSPYQRVTTAFDVTEAGQRDCYGVRADGIDDFYTTGGVNLDATERVTVFAAVRKLSDVNAGLVVEFGNVGTTNGTFDLRAPRSNGAANYRFGSRGTVLSDATASPFIAPHTAILTAESVISSDICTLRVNGVSAGTSATDQGTGNFSNQAFNLLGRTAASLNANLRLYALIVAGGSYPLSTIQRVERILSRITPTVNL
jgi:hypothetical protein